MRGFYSKKAFFALAQGILSLAQAFEVQRAQPGTSHRPEFEKLQIRRERFAATKEQRLQLAMPEVEPQKRPVSGVTPAGVRTVVG